MLGTFLVANFAVLLPSTWALRMAYLHGAILAAPRISLRRAALRERGIGDGLGRAVDVLLAA